MACLGSLKTHHGWRGAAGGTEAVLKWGAVLGHPDQQLHKVYIYTYIYIIIYTKRLKRS